MPLKRILFLLSTLLLIVPSFEDQSSVSPQCFLLGWPKESNVSFYCVPALFGWRNETLHGVTAAAVVAPPTARGGCECTCGVYGVSHVASPQRKFIAVVPRGEGCSFATKAIAAQQCGATALLVINNEEVSGSTSGDDDDGYNLMGAFAMGASPDDEVKVSIPVAMAPKSWISKIPGAAQALPNWCEILTTKTTSESLAASNLTITMTRRSTTKASHLTSSIAERSPLVMAEKLGAVAEELQREGRFLDAVAQLKEAVDTAVLGRPFVFADGDFQNASSKDEAISAVEVRLKLQLLWLKQDLCNWQELDETEHDFWSTLSIATLRAAAATVVPSGRVSTEDYARKGIPLTYSSNVIELGKLCPKLSPSLRAHPSLVHSVCAFYAHYSAPSRLVPLRSSDFTALQDGFLSLRRNSRRTLSLAYVSAFLHRPHPLRYVIGGIVAAHHRYYTHKRALGLRDTGTVAGADTAVVVAVNVSCVLLNAILPPVDDLNEHLPHSRTPLKVEKCSEGAAEDGVSRSSYTIEVGSFEEASYGPVQPSINREDLEAALQFRRRTEDEPIDVLIDVDGHTGGHLLRGLLGHSSALVHIHYLGTPHFPQYRVSPSPLAATTTTPLRLDFFLSDATLTPPDLLFLVASPSRLQGPYSHLDSERLLLVPHYMMYQPPHMDNFEEEDHGPSLKGSGATKPQDDEDITVFIFACFNQGKKIHPLLFGVWMDILLRVNAVWAASPGGKRREARLWLPQVDSSQLRDDDIDEEDENGHQIDARNLLEAEAAARGVPKRWLIFSRRVNNRDSHLQRMVAADVALDTGYGSHFSIASRFSNASHFSSIDSFESMSSSLVVGGGYSAGSVAIEALLQGIPLVVLAGGTTVAERQAASVARAILLPFASTEDSQLGTTFDDNGLNGKVKQGRQAWEVLSAYSIKEYADTAVRLALLPREAELRLVESSPSQYKVSSAPHSYWTLAHFLAQKLCKGPCGCRSLSTKGEKNENESDTVDLLACPISSLERVADIERGAAACFEVLSVARARKTGGLVDNNQNLHAAHYHIYRS